MKDRTYILLSVPNDFVEKLSGFINNVNVLNDDLDETTIKVEKVFLKKKSKFAAVPKP